MGIKHIVIIADHTVRKQAHIQTHLKRTDPVFLCIGFYQFPCKTDFMSQHIINRVIYPVKMPFGVGTCHRIALCLLQKTDLIPGSQYYRLKQQPPFPQNGKGFFRHRAGDGFCSQIKQLFRHPLPHRLYRRKYGGQCFSHARGRFDKQLSFVIKGLIDIGDQFFLTFPVGEREIHLPDGLLSFFFPLHLIVRPFLIGLHQPLKPFLQVLKPVVPKEILQFFRLYIAVGHTHSDKRQAILLCINISITLRLRQMHHDRRFHPADIRVSTLDLIYDNRVTYSVRVLILRYFRPCPSRYIISADILRLYYGFNISFCRLAFYFYYFFRFCRSFDLIPSSSLLTFSFPLLKTDRHLLYDALCKLPVNNTVRPAFHKNIILWCMITIL